MCPQVRGGRPESSSGSEATKMGHKIITAELLSVAQLITTFFCINQDYGQVDIDK